MTGGGLMDSLDYRKEIARYLLSLGALDQAPGQQLGTGATSQALDIPFPDGLAPVPRPLLRMPRAGATLPRADVLVITWAVAEHQALADVLTPGVDRSRWYGYSRGLRSQYLPLIRYGAPSRLLGQLGSYLVTDVGTKRVLCFKSELHLNQDGIPTGDGTATLPVKDLFKQLIREVRPEVVLTVGTAGSVFANLGDVVVTRAARFRLQREFRNEPFNEKVFRSEWTLPLARLAAAEELMRRFASDLLEPPVAPPTTRYQPDGPLASTPANVPTIKLDGRDIAEFHPILTVDYFEYGTSTNHLEADGCAVEMGDAALGLACSELEAPPKWAVVRNMSDPVINGDLPTDEYHLNAQTMWAVGYYTAYGYYTSVIGAIATWGLIAGL